MAIQSTTRFPLWGRMVAADRHYPSSPERHAPRPRRTSTHPRTADHIACRGVRNSELQTDCGRPIRHRGTPASLTGHAAHPEVPSASSPSRELRPARSLRTTSMEESAVPCRSVLGSLANRIPSVTTEAAKVE